MNIDRFVVISIASGTLCERTMEVSIAHHTIFSHLEAVRSELD
jgi:hypothetical protein